MSRAKRIRSVCGTSALRLSVTAALALGPIAIFDASADASAPPAVAFPIRTIRLARQKITAEIADTPQARERGLMFRTELKDGHGMLFVFEEERVLGFWMKNTLIPLSIGFFDANKSLIDVQEMEPASPAELRPRSYQSARPAKYALEMPKGWFSARKIPMGAKLVVSPASR